MSRIGQKLLKITPDFSFTIVLKRTVGEQPRAIIALLFYFFLISNVHILKLSNIKNDR